VRPVICGHCGVRVQCSHISKRCKQRIWQKQLPLFLKTRGCALAFESRIYLMPLMNRTSTDCTVFHILAYGDFKAACLVKRHNTTRFIAEAQRFWQWQNCENRLLASSYLSVCVSVRPQETTWLPLHELTWHSIPESFIE